MPHYGLKEHAAVDVEHGLILSTNITPASHSDSTYLPYATIYSMHTEQKIEVVQIKDMRALQIETSFQ